jgi:anthranilate phosphoribosyltransferase
MIKILKKIKDEERRFNNFNYKEAFFLQKKILNSQVPDLELGFLFRIMEIKGETEEEIKGFLDAVRDEINYIDSDEIKPLNLPINYRKKRTLNIFPASIFIAAGAGAKIAVHCNEYNSCNFSEILEKMGCSYIENKSKILRALELSGFAFLNQKQYAPKLHILSKKVRELGFETYLDRLELFLNPFKTSKILLGTYTKSLVQKYMEIAYYMGFNNVFIINGLEGGIEPFIDRETKIYSNRIFGINIYPKGMNINPSSLKLTYVDQNAKVCLSILKNKNHTLTKWAVLTSAILLIAYGITEDLKEAIDMSEKSLKLNSANEMFEIYKNISNSEMKTNV